MCAEVIWRPYMHQPVCMASVSIMTHPSSLSKGKSFNDHWCFDSAEWEEHMGKVWGMANKARQCSDPPYVFDFQLVPNTLSISSPIHPCSFTSCRLHPNAWESLAQGSSISHSTTAEFKPVVEHQGCKSANHQAASGTKDTKEADLLPRREKMKKQNHKAKCSARCAAMAGVAAIGCLQGQNLLGNHWEV